MRPGLIPLQVAFSTFNPIRHGSRRTTMSDSSSSSPNFTLGSYPSDPPNYETWTREELIARLKELTGPSIPQSASTTSHSTDATTSSSPVQQPARPTRPSESSKPLKLPQQQQQHKSKPKPTPSKKSAKSKTREFDFSAYPTWKIALRFSYAGAGYGGLTWQATEGPLPTVEGVLFDALAKAKLVDPQGGLEACGWERCGRTDRGVSAAGQVVSLYVRSSNRRCSPPSAAADAPSAGTTSEGDPGLPTTETEDAAAPDSGGGPPLVPPRATQAEDTSMDVRYLRTLNGILPPEIRVHAWAPVAPTFSARFSCRVRHYKYFFSARDLDVDAMRTGAARLVGEHDFRNVCKLDPAKQLTSFRRRILRADISPLVGGGGGGGMHVLDLVGTAFLYNQVRHIMAVLLLIGAQLESPSVISALLNTGPDPDPGSDAGHGHGHGDGEEPPPRVTCKPVYQMADALPLVLWDCVYAPEDAPWRTDGAGMEGGSVGLHSQLTGLVERAQVEATLAEHFLAAASQFHAPAPRLLWPPAAGEGGPWNVPLGGGMARREGTYVPLLERKRLESVEVVNARWLARKGGR
ncbi:pseudouridine synthase [Russula brevipes]|nr:pseudouridine synthase [Russula brevipes]